MYEACIGVLRYGIFANFQGYRIFAMLLPGRWDTMFKYRDTLIFLRNYQIQLNLSKAVTQKEDKNWFSRPIIV